MKRKHQQLKLYDGGKIQKFESFFGSEFAVKNRHLRSVLEELEQRGITVSSVEEPEWGTNGMIELTDTSYLTLTIGRNNKKIKAGIELSDGSFRHADATEDLDEALKALKALKLRHSINEADYTSDYDGVKSQHPTPFLKRQRAEKVGKAASLVENAIQELKHVPRLDEMSDIPDIISKLGKIMGEDGEIGLNNLHKLYENER